MATSAYPADNSDLLSDKLGVEIEKMEREEMLPIEKKLLGWSIGTGAGLILLLYWLSVTFFPVGH